jgi:hypothetical protein
MLNLYEKKLNKIAKHLNINSYDMTKSNSDNTKPIFINNETIKGSSYLKSPFTIKKEKLMMYFKLYWVYIILITMSFSILYILKPNFILYEDDKKNKKLYIKKYLLFASLISILVSVIYNITNNRKNKLV